MNTTNLQKEHTYALFEYDIRNDSFVSNQDYISEHPNLSRFIEKLKSETQSSETNGFAFSFSSETNPEATTQNFYCDFFPIIEGKEVIRIIGSIKPQSLNLIQPSELPDLELEMKKNSIFGQTMKNYGKTSPLEVAQLAQGHQLLALLQENMKYADDIASELHKCLEIIATFFRLDRILVLESDLSAGVNTINYQWNSKPENTLTNYFQTMSEEEIVSTIRTYDTYGYIEVNPTFHIYTMSEAISDHIFNEVISDVLLGTQLWIPTLSGGKYSGAILFDKYDTTPYTNSEKFILSEFVNSVSTYIERLNAENANKAKSDFLSTMSHEIRTPMNAILGMTEVALREDMAPDIRKCLKTVQSSAFGLLTLINDILDYSKIEAGKLDIVPEKFHILSLINDVYEITKARNNNKLDLIMNIPDNLPSYLFGDFVRIKQVMINLCTNAIKYTDEGSVTVSFHVRKEDDSNCRLMFAVKDTGIGIRKGDIRKLFKQYGQVDTTVNHHKEGTGLGLMISKQLIDAMNGKISVESTYGKGSTFYFQIPLAVDDWTPAGTLENYHYEDTETDTDYRFTAPDAKILVVDDTPLNLVVAKALLSPIGMTIETAEDGLSALTILKDNTYDLILMDHFMPGMDGVETTQKIRALDGNANQNIPIIALTADVVDGVKEELLSHGMNDFLAKPILIGQAYQILHHWLPKDKIIDAS